MRVLKTTGFNKYKFNIVGTPTITDDGIASGFSNSINYLRVPFTFGTTSTYRIDMTVTTASNPITNGYILGGAGQFFEIYNASNSFIFNYRKSDNTYSTIKFFDISASTTYNMYYEFNLSSLVVTVGFKKYTDSVYQNASVTIPSYKTLLDFTNIGNTSNDCSIDLKQFSIMADGVKVFSGTGNVYRVFYGDGFNRSAFTAVGSPTITDDGMYSSSTNSNYAVVDLTEYLAGKNNVKISFSMNITDGTKNGYLLLGSTSDSSAVNAYWNGSGATDVGFIVNGVAENRTAVTTGTAAGAYKFEYSLTSSASYITVTKPNGSTVTANVARKNSGATYQTGNVVLKIGYLDGAIFDLKTLKVSVNSTEVFSGTAQAYQGFNY